MDIITGFPTYFMAFIHHLDGYHMIQGGVIALFLGVATATVTGLFIVPIVAALLYIAADTVIPPLLHHSTITMPVFNKALLEEAIALYVAFFIAIAVVFAIKKAIMAVTGR